MYKIIVTVESLYQLRYDVETLEGVKKYIEKIFTNGVNILIELEDMYFSPSKISLIKIQKIGWI